MIHTLQDGQEPSYETQREFIEIFETQNKLCNRIKRFLIILLLCLAAGVTTTLEAYLAGVKDGSIKSVTAADGSKWNLSYVAASSEENTEITVGANAEYVISGDNMGGFIVAVKAAS